MKFRDVMSQLLLNNKLSLTKMTKIDHVEEFIAKNRPRSVGKELIRLGGLGDGGYLIPDDLEGIKTCFSPGVEQVSDLEDSLAKQYGMQSFMADYSVDGPALKNDKFHFTKKFLGTQNNEKYMRFEDWVDEYADDDDNDMLLQMDIENSEYPVIIDTPSHVFDRFRIMLIEFHALESIFDEGAFPLFDAVFDKLRTNFTIAHIHPNNWEPIKNYGDVAIPSVMEFTFLRNDRVTLDNRPLTFPHKLDVINNKSKPPRHLPKCWWPS